MPLEGPPLAHCGRTGRRVSPPPVTPARHCRVQPARSAEPHDSADARGSCTRSLCVPALGQHAPCRGSGAAGVKRRRVRIEFGHAAARHGPGVGVVPAGRGLMVHTGEIVHHKCCSPGSDVLLGGGGGDFAVRLLPSSALVQNVGASQCEHCNVVATVSWAHLTAVVLHAGLQRHALQSASVAPAVVRGGMAVEPFLAQGARPAYVFFGTLLPVGTVLSVCSVRARAAQAPKRKRNGRQAVAAYRLQVQ